MISDPFLLIFLGPKTNKNKGPKMAKICLFWAPLKVC